MARGFNPVACATGDICEGGMLVTDIESDRMLQHFRQSDDCPVEVHLFCQQAGTEAHLRVLARVRRVVDDCIGVEFVQPTPELMSTLLEPGNAHVGRYGGLRSSAKRRGLWRTVAQQSRDWLKQLLADFQRLALEALQDRLDASSQFEEINRLRDARLLLLEAEPAINRDFFADWTGLQPGSNEDEATEKQRQVDLRLVDKVFFEDWLELQMVATAVTNRHRPELFIVNQLLSQVIGSDVDDKNNPLAPTVLCQCLQHAIARREFPSSVKSILYHAFEQTLTESWPDFLHRLSDWLEGQGLRAVPLEKMRSNWSELRVPKKAGPALSTGEGRAEERDAVGTVPVSRSPRHRGTVLRLMRMGRGDEVSAPAGNVLEPRDVSKRLFTHRQQLRNRLSHQQVSLREALDEVVDGDRPLKEGIGEDVWDVVSVVDGLFSPLSRGENGIEPALLGLLEQLRLPLLQILLRDNDFLENPEHPARRILNHIVSLCSADRASSKNLERMLATVIDEIMQEETLSASQLQDIGDRLESLVKRQEHAFVRNAERVAKTCEGQQRLDHARRTIQRRINMLLAGREIPLVLLELLEGGWEQQMVLALLKEGADGTHLASLFSVIEQLQGWLGRDSQGDSAFERELEAPALVEQIERELVTTGEPARYKPVLQHLNAVLKEERRVDYVWLTAYPLSEAQDSAAEGPPETGRWADRAQQLAVGDWVTLDSDEGPQRMSLVWVGDDAYKFVFLTEHGLHETAYSFAELADQLQQGRLQPIAAQDVPFVDRSLYELAQDLYKKMASQALHDPLTGCLYRHEFEKQLARVVLQVPVRHASAALLMVDIDQFSVINASYGTAAGDAMLKGFQDVLVAGLDDFAGAHLVGRMGSNEFALLLYPCLHEQALDLAEQLRNRLSLHRYHHEGQAFQASVSMGLVLIESDIPDAGTLLNQASLACSAAKRSGGNRVRPFREGDRDQAHQQEMLSWVTRIDKALDEDALELRAQRIRSLEEGVPDRYEILLGLKGEAGRDWSPALFVEAAERFHRSSRLDRWVVNKVLEWAASHADKLGQIGGLNINLSGYSLSDDGFLSFLEQRMQVGDVPAEKICFEITETAAVANLHYTADFIRELKRSGCQFALDDFGTGFASYAYLQKLPVDFLKIDGVFVRDLGDNLTNYAMVRSINELGHFLGMNIIAEYVENMEILEALREIRVDFAQGFGVGKPRPLDGLL